MIYAMAPTNPGTDTPAGILVPKPHHYRGLTRSVLEIPLQVLKQTTNVTGPLLTQITVRSAPRVLLSTVVAEDTRALVVQLPSDLPTGRHRLTISLLDADGHAVAKTIELRVTEPIPWWMWVLCGLGGVAAIAGGLFCWRAWRLR